VKSHLISGLGLGALALALASGGGCTLALDWEQCSDDSDCPLGFACSSAGDCRGGSAGKSKVEVTQSINVSTTWTADNDYLLKDVIYVAPGATLTILSGTTIYGEQASSLVVRPGGRIDARGTKAEPVVFTSAKPVGQRAPADWGGVALLGRASVNLPDPVFEAIEDTALGAFGGTDDTHPCGVMQFTRIEYAGYAINSTDEYNGLTLAGCGSETLIDHVQIHMSGDDGIQILGGTANLKHIVMTSITKDGLDWELGWRGKAQFVVVQQGDDDENAFESVNNDDFPDASPRSEPTIYNFTLIGSGANGGNQRAIYMEAGAGGHFFNGIVMGQSLEALDIVSPETALLLQSGTLEFQHTLFFDAGATGTHFFPLDTEEVGEEDDDGGFDENQWLRKLDYNNALGVDPQLGAPFDRQNPGWVPPVGVLDGLAKRPPVDMDQSGDYLGAFQPGAAPWSDGWTAFPEN
jgi:hypothetical protein